MSKVTLINHSCLLFDLGKKNKFTFLTDFWNQSPSFGSWLPSALPFYHPTYLAALSYNQNFYLVISHAHDDHIDDDFLKNYFNKKMPIIINEFPSPSLKKRINGMGFKNVISVGKNIRSFPGFDVISIFDENLSNDDAGIAFRDKDFCIYHGNDNWHELKGKNLSKLKNFSKGRKFLYAAQTNSASGHPLIYPQFKKSKTTELKKKVRNMVLAGLRNTNNLGADFFLPYAGFAKPYVKGKSYESDALDPTYKNLIELIKVKKIQGKNKIIDLFCGGTIDLSNGKIEYPFTVNPNKVFEVTTKYMKQENIIQGCDGYREDLKPKPINNKQIKIFLSEFNEFVNNYLARFPRFYPTIIGKKLKITVENKNEKKINQAIEIGTGKFLKSNERVNKEFRIPNNLFMAVYEKKIPFENIYTGYQSDVFRYPLDIYNRDILMYLITFGYKYFASKK